MLALGCIWNLVGNAKVNDSVKSSLAEVMTLHIILHCNHTLWWQLLLQSQPAPIVVKLWSSQDTRKPACDHDSKLLACAVNKSMSIDLEEEGVTCVLLHPGYVRTDMTSQAGLINVDQSVSGLLSVLESDLPLNGKWYDYKQEAIPWWPAGEDLQQRMLLQLNLHLSVGHCNARVQWAECHLLQV